MKRMVIIFICLCLVTGAIIVSCSKSTADGFSQCSGPTAASDSSTLLAFAKKDTITAVADTSWLYYQIINQGTGASPISTSKITVTYIGELMNGSVFDSAGASSPLTIPLDSLILGWQYGLQKIQVGGRIKLLIPSALAYGCSGFGNIPPNTPLYFDITLLGVQ